jgi:hypothetical protein
MEVVHGVQPLAEAAQRDGNLDDMRELPLNGFPAGAAFIATHLAIFCPPPALVKPITARVPQYPHDRGHAATHEQAMADFKAAWGA